MPLALASIKDRQGWTPPEIADFLQELLENHDNSRNLYTADTFLISVVTAVGRLKVGAEQVRSFLNESSARQLDTQHKIEVPSDTDLPQGNTQ